jgi:hypothetical protein
MTLTSRIKFAIEAVLIITSMSHLVASSEAAVISDTNTSNNQIDINLLSANYVNSTTGQYVLVKGNISNLDIHKPVSGIAYISIVDVYNNQPIDLEDWSVQKGIYLSIPPNQSVATEWNLRLVSAGFYTVTVIFAGYGNYPPKTSSRIILEVLPKMNLNPSNIIPVAFGIPMLMMIILGLINYRRGKKMGIYG